MTTLELDASKAIKELTELVTIVRSAGKRLDELKMAEGLTTSLDRVTNKMAKLGDAIGNDEAELDRLKKAFDTLKFSAEGAYTGIVAAQRKAEIVADAYAKTQHELHEVLRSTDSHQVYIALQKQLNVMQEKNLAQTAILTKQIELLSTEQGKLNAITKIQLKTKEAEVTQSAKLEAENAKLHIQMQNLHSARGQEIAQGKLILKDQTSLVTSSTKLALTIRNQGRELANLNDVQSRSAATNRILLDAFQKSAVASAKLVAEEIRLRTSAELETTAEWKRVEALKAADKARKDARAAQQADAAFLDQKTQQLAKLRREYEYLHSEEGKQAALLKQQIAAALQQQAAETELSNTLAKQATRVAQLTSAKGQAVERNKVFIQVLQDTATASARVAAEEVKLIEVAKLETSAVFKRVEALKAQKQARDAARAAEAAEANFYQEKSQALSKLNMELQYLNTEEGKRAANTKILISAANDQITAETKLSVALERQAREVATLNSSKGRALETNKILINSLKEEAVAVAKLVAEEARLIRSAKLEETAIFKRVQALNASKAARQAAIQAEQEETLFLDKKSQALKKLTLELQYAQSVEGKKTELTKLQIQAANEQSVAEAKLTLTLENQKRQITELNSAKGRSVENNRILINAMKEANTAAAQLTAQEMKLTKQAELETTAVYKRVRALEASAAARRTQRSAEEEEASFYAKKSQALTKLTRELQYLHTVEAKQAAQLKQQIAEQNKLLMTNTTAHAKRNATINVGAQATAALRAALAGAQTSIGMYTSSTIVAASAVYAFARALRSGMEVGIQFTTAMARTQAIMGASIAGTNGLFSSLDSQVRLLGETTQFTVTQVAEAVTELGQAGLSAGQSLIALQPALDLAIIGNLSMAASADHVTNIMMIFGKQATDLTNIVDVLATAVVSSNTNVEQLANALTYAGPAAHALGVSMEDTVAAIEALANSGFKASRAGTALRRLFVSLANPTAKGQAVLDKYSIAVTDLHGNARELTDILKQMDVAFKDLSGTEKLAAIQDLVGVYATSPVAGLLANVDGFAALRVQLELTAGAAQKMKATIENGLEFDIKEVKSAFQELQLNVFKDNEMQFRVWALELREFIQFLGTETETGATNLEVYAARIEATIKLLAGVWAGMKVLTVARHVNEMGYALARSRLAYIEKAAAARIAATAVDTATVATVRATAAEKAHAIATQVATNSSKAKWMTMGAGALRFAGVAGAIFTVGTVLYGVYEAYKAIGEVSKPLKEHQEQEIARAKKLTAEYAKLKEEAKAYQDTRSKDNLLEQKASIELAIRETQTQQRNLMMYRRTMARDDPQREVVSSYQTLAKKNLADQRATLAAINTELLGHVDNYGEIQELRNQDAILTQRVAAGTLSAKHADIERIPILERIAELRRQIAEDESRSGVAQNRENERLRAAQRYLETAANTAFGGVLADERASKDAAVPLAEQLAAREAAYLEAKKAYSSAVFLQTQALENPKFSQTAAETALADSAKKLQSLGTGLVKLREEVAKQQQSYTASNEALMEAEMTAADLRNKQISEQQVLMAAVAEDKRKLAANEVVDFVAAEGRNKRLLELNKELKKDTAPKPPKPDKTAVSNINVYESLRQKYDAVGHSAAAMSVSQDVLKGLLKEGQIGASEYSLALAQLRKDHAAVVLAADKHAMAAKRVSESYLKSGADKQIQDLVDIKAAFENGAIAAGHYQVVLDRIQDSRKVTGMPTVQMPTNESDGPFSQFLSAATTQANDVATFNTAFDTEDSEFANLTARLQMQEQAEIDAAAAREMGAEEHARALAEIRGRYHDLGVQGTEDYNSRLAQLQDQQAEYTQNSNMLVMASMAGSLSSLLGMVASASEDASGIQKAAFVAQKALSIAQIMVNTEVAASLVGAQMGYAGISMATMIRAQGYASAGLVAAMAIGELGGGAKSSGGGSSNYAGAYDSGGYIPTGKFGIVGEYGPEIVNGPANVVGREASARRLNQQASSSNGPQSVTIAPEINVTYTSEGSTNPREDATQLGQVIKIAVMDTIRDQLRPNGMLFRG